MCYRSRHGARGSHDHIGYQGVKRNQPLRFSVMTAPFCADSMLLACPSIVYHVPYVMTCQNYTNIQSQGCALPPARPVGKLSLRTTFYLRAQNHQPFASHQPLRRRKGFGHQSQRKRDASPGSLRLSSQVSRHAASWPGGAEPRHAFAMTRAVAAARRSTQHCCRQLNEVR